MNDLIKEKYREGLVKYRGSNKPHNYIPFFIKKELNIWNINNQELYMIINDLKKENLICPQCNKKQKKYLGFNKGFSKYCSVDCMHKYQRTPAGHDFISKKLKGRPSKLKGKTYEEIHGTKNVKCGYQRGENNIAKRVDIRKKISIGVLLSYKNNPELIEKRRVAAYKNKIYLNKKSFNLNLKDKNENLRRSKLEVLFSNLLIDNDISFVYERVVKMINNHMKVVDFLINDDLYVEISGYAYEGWRADFDYKIKVLKNSINVNKKILILTYPEFVDILKNRTNDNNIIIESVYECDKVLNIIKENSNDKNFKNV